MGLGQDLGRIVAQANEAIAASKKVTPTDDTASVLSGQKKKEEEKKKARSALGSNPQITAIKSALGSR